MCVSVHHHGRVASKDPGTGATGGCEPLVAQEVLGTKL